MPIEIQQEQQTSHNWFVKDIKVNSELPTGYSIRPLIESDFHNGYLECLSQLTSIGEITEKQFKNQFNLMNNSGQYKSIVITNKDGKVVACGTVLLEHKFIHYCGILAHIEDIVVDGGERGTGLGKLVIEQLKVISKASGAYKITLDCALHNEAFYAKRDFVTKGLQMCIYL